MGVCYIHGGSAQHIRRSNKARVVHFFTKFFGTLKIAKLNETNLLGDLHESFWDEDCSCLASLKLIYAISCDFLVLPAVGLPNETNLLGDLHESFWDEDCSCLASLKLIYAISCDFLVLPAVGLPIAMYKLCT